jgi:two-component system, cell cycle response regulator
MNNKTNERAPSPKPPSVKSLSGVSVYLLEDDAVTRKIYSQWLQEAGATIIVSDSLEAFRLHFDGPDGFNSNLKKAPKIAIIDLVLPDGDGLEAVELWKRLLPQNPVMVCTAFATVENAVLAMKMGAFDFLRKPISREELVLVVKKSWMHAELVDQNKSLKTSLGVLQMAQALSSCVNKIDLLKTLGRLLYRESGCLECYVFDYSASKKILEPILDLRFVGRPRSVPEEVLSEVIPDFDKMLVEAPQNLASVDFNVLVPHTVSRVSVKNALTVKLASPSSNFGLLLLICDPLTYEELNERFELLQPLCMQGARTYQSLDVSAVLSFVDELTGLYNQRFLEVALQNEITKASRSNAKLCLVFLDLDKFKSINDTHGHLVGSQMIKEAAKILKANVRDSDYVLRYGGDEFCAILPGAGSEGAFLVTERIRRAFELATFDLSEVTGVRSAQNIHVTSSIGVSCFPDSASQLKDLIQQADIAMYLSKKAGRNRVTFFQHGTSPEINS